ncbi:MAG: sulfite exporter TauE/SafE family protein [Eubacterium sp.]
MKELIVFIILGFAAEMIDGTMGMAYGVSSNTFLRSAGVNSAISSACVHIAELFTTLVSGISHIKLKNVSKNLFFKLLIPGIIGGAIGAYLLVSFESKILDIIIDCYLIVMGIIIFSKIFKKPNEPREYGNYARVLGFAGGFSDALGGGGWSPGRNLNSARFRARYQENNRNREHRRILCNNRGNYYFRCHDA